MATPASGPLLPRAWYTASIDEFLVAEPRAVLGTLAVHSEFDISQDQRNVWAEQIEMLRAALAGLSGRLLLEFDIPRMDHRADAIVLAGALLFVLEFKSRSELHQHDLNQVCDYALDLRHFHAASHRVPILPIVVLGDSNTAEPDLRADPDDLFRPVAVGAAGLHRLLVRALDETPGVPIDAVAWQLAPYHPTPTIIEAARALYSQHRVEEIAYSEAGGDNLRRTSERLIEIVAQTRHAKRKAICFVTGVPGAGKTLVGLNLATHAWADSSEHAVYTSGNGPLVKVLRAALTADARCHQNRPHLSQEVSKFIQSALKFRDDALSSSAPPSERVVIFDEAQRAWNQRKLTAWMKRNKGLVLNLSEPEVLMSCMDRHQDWTAVVCLIGGGQEINAGEAGVATWLEEIRTHFADWDTYAPPILGSGEYAAGDALHALQLLGRVHLDQALHLAVSVRSFRAENVSAFVKALLDCDRASARAEQQRLVGRFPIVLTRSLDAAKRWVREHARGSERYGLVASSKAMRLKPHAIDVRVEIDPVHWFLDDSSDTRSSFYLEDAATEFQVQGLELDWTCVTWDGDLRVQDGSWSHHDFRGSKWQNIHNDWNQLYVRNAYRVLLTRARQGMAIFVPPGDAADPTRLPAFYDSTFRYLADLGLPVLA